MSTLKAGVYQCDGAGLTPGERLDKLATAIAGRKLDLVVCPELYLSGYNIDDKLHSLAEPADGRLCQATAKLAKAYGTAIVAGFPERDGDVVYNSAICIDATGKQIALHRKLAIPPGFERNWFTPGGKMTIFDLGGIKCALLICYDVEFPETVRAACSAGVEIVIAPTALGSQWDQVATRVIPSRAFENGCYMLYSNHAGSEGELAYSGLSCIVDPDGRDVARAGSEEELITAILDTQHVAAARRRLPYMLELEELVPKLA